MNRSQTSARRAHGGCSTFSPRRAQRLVVVEKTLTTPLGIGLIIAS